MNATATLPSYPAVQVAYLVTNIEQAAASMAATFGAGPFFIINNIELAWAEHRGAPCPFVHSSAYGQWGEVMLELVQEESTGPSPFRDLFAPGQTGLHHIATIVDSLADAYEQYQQAGLPLVTRAMTRTGTEFSFFDATAQLGHFIEVYAKTPELLAFYEFVRNAAVDWQGQDPVRSFSPN